MRTHDQCCRHDCAQRRVCPRHAERRGGPSVLRGFFGWLIQEKRNAFDRRARVDMGGLSAMNSSPSEEEAQNIGTPEFHRLLQKVCEVETVLAAAGATSAVYEAFESASNARKALIAYVDGKLIHGHQSAPAQLLQALRDGIPLQEPVFIGKALLAQLEAHVVLDAGTGPVAAVHLVNIGLTGWIHTKETAEAYAKGYNTALKQYRATLLELANEDLGAASPHSSVTRTPSRCVGCCQPQGQPHKGGCVYQTFTTGASAAPSSGQIDE